MATKLDIQTTGALTAKKAGVGKLKAYFEANKDALKESLPEHIDADRMLRVALGAYRTTPRLAEVEIKSAFSAILTCAQLGLEPNSPLGQCSLVPFRNGGQTDCQLIIQYRGFITLAARVGISIAAHIVYEGDEFDLEFGLSENIMHRPCGREDIDTARGVYAVATHPNGRKQFEWVWAHAVHRVRDEALGKIKEEWKRDKSPWRTHPAPMWRKTAVRRLANYLELSPDEAKAYRSDGATGSELSDAIEGKFSVVAGDPDTRFDEGQNSETERENSETENPAPPAAAQEKPEKGAENPADDTKKPASLSIEIYACESAECLDEIADRLRTMAEAKQISVAAHIKATRQIKDRRAKLAQQS